MNVIYGTGHASHIAPMGISLGQSKCLYAQYTNIHNNIFLIIPSTVKSTECVFKHYVLLLNISTQPS